MADKTCELSASIADDRMNGRDFRSALVEYRLALMSQRIQTLEDALQIEVCEDHPLLATELLAIKQGADPPSTSKREEGEGSVNEGPGRGGTLAISTRRGTRFLGSSAVEVCLYLFLPQESKLRLHTRACCFW